MPANNQTYGVTDAEAERELNWKAIAADHQANDKEAQKASRSVTAVNGDEADTIGDGFTRDARRR